MKKLQHFFIYAVVPIFFLAACNTNERQTGEKQTVKKDESSLWYEKPMRIAAMQCNFDDEDHLAVLDKWKQMGFNVEQLFHTIADGYSAVYDPGKDKVALTEYVKKAHQNGIKVILYLNIHFLDPKVENKKEEWSQRTKDGTISMMYGTYYSTCLNSPWKDYFFSILDSLNEVDIDGIFLDGPVIVNGGCYCDRCMTKYHEMFDGKRGTEKEKRWEFNAVTKDEFLQDVYDHYKKNNPEKVVYMNLPITSTRQQYVRIDHALKYNDILGTEGGFMFYGPAKKAYLWRPSFTAKLIEAVAPEKPRVIFMAADHKPWSWWMHSPLETKLCISSVTANGANTWWGMHGSSKLFQTETVEAAGEVLNFYKKNENFLTSAKSAAEVALFYSFSTVSNEIIDFNEKVSGKKLGNQEDAIRGYYSMLTEMQVPFDMITDFEITTEKLAPYQVLVMPNTYSIDQRTESVVRDFVKRGGLLITESGTSLFDMSGKRKTEFGLADVLGLSASGIFKEHANYNYFVFEPDNPYSKNISSPFIPLPLLSLEVRPLNKTKVLARALEDLPGRYVPMTSPGDDLITLNHYGAGKAVYFAGNFGEMYNEYHVMEYKMFMKNVISEKLTEGIVFVNAPVNLEVVLRKQENRKILHLVNYQAGPTRPFEKVTTVHGMTVKIPKSWGVTKVSSQRLGEQLALTEKGAYIEAALPELHDFEMLIME